MNDQSLKELKLKANVLTNRERLLLLYMVIDYQRGRIVYEDAPENLLNLFFEICPNAMIRRIVPKKK